MTETILQEAERIINGDRQDTYGPPSESLGRIAVLWGAYLDREMSANEVANLLILMKVSRSKNGYHRDSYVDIAGYAGLTEKLGVEPPRLTEYQWNDIVRTGQPRQWENLADVPTDVPVYSSSGTYWKFWLPGETDDVHQDPPVIESSDRGAWLWSMLKSKPGHRFGRIGPFTEVIDG